jgi:hypothetical protein
MFVRFRSKYDNFVEFVKDEPSARGKKRRDRAPTIPASGADIVGLPAVF